MSDEKEPVDEQEKEKAAEPEQADDEAVSDEPAPKVDVAAEEVHQLSRPPVIDVNALLQPISAEAPSGEYMRYSGIYDELSDARRADEVLEQGAWQEELKVADFKKVLELAIPVLTKETKDLQIAAWLAEALSAEHGFEGARDSLALITGLVLKFWDTLFPEIDEGDEEGRANALDWIDEKIGDLLRTAPITVDGWGYNGYTDSKKFDIPENVEGMSSDEQLKFSALRDQAERENRATATKWKQAVAKTKRAFCEEVDVAISECSAAYDKLNLAIEEKFDRNQAPSLPVIKKALSDIKSRADKLLAQKKIEEPDPADIEDEAGEDGESNKRGGMKGAINNRTEALRRLSEIAAFFRSTEPHSPVSYLVNRAVNWGSMPLDVWLQDVIKDQNILGQLKQTLGFNTTGDTEEQSGAESPEAPPGQPLQ